MLDTYDPFIAFGDDSDVEGDEDEQRDEGDEDESEQGDEDGGEAEFAFGEWTDAMRAVSDAWLGIPMDTSAMLDEEEGEQEPKRERKK